MVNKRVIIIIIIFLSICGTAVLFKSLSICQGIAIIFLNLM